MHEPQRHDPRLSQAASTLAHLSKLASTPLFVLGCLLVLARLAGWIATGWLLVMLPWLVAIALPAGVGGLIALDFKRHHDSDPRDSE